MTHDWTARFMNEHVRGFLRGTVLLPLIARVVAAPIALRRPPVGDPSRGPRVVRVCSWPLPTFLSRSDKLTIGDMTDAPEADPMRPGSSHLNTKSSPCIHPLPPGDTYARRSIAR